MIKQLENRYIVIKRTDIDRYLTMTDRCNIGLISGAISKGRTDDNKSPIEAIVVKKNFPEYHAVEEAIIGRINGEEHQTLATPWAWHQANRALEVAHERIRELEEQVKDLERLREEVTGETSEQRVNRVTELLMNYEEEK